MLYMSLAETFTGLLYDPLKPKNPFIIMEAIDVYEAYFNVKTILGKKKKYLSYDYFCGGYFPNVMKSSNPVKLSSLEETLKYFYTAADLDILLLCLDVHSIDENILSLLQYISAAPNKASKRIGIIIKSATQLYSIGNVINKVNTLKYLSKLSLDTEVVGLNSLRSWLTDRKVLLSGNHPVGLKGISLIGIPGSGKTVSAQLAAKVFGLPAYKFNIHNCLGKYVGDSEANTELAFKEVESLGKCVILLDEVDKVFNSNDDNQTTGRVLSILLNYMQLNKNVFWVLTGNNIEDVPPELLRKGRLDEYFYIGLPEYETVKEYIKYKFSVFERHVDYPFTPDLITYVAKECINNKLIFSDIESLCDYFYISICNKQGIDTGLISKASSYKRYENEYNAILKWSEQNAKSAI